MPKLFFRKKKKAKNAKEKPHIKGSLAPRPAFAAVPSTPPPSSRHPTVELQERSASLPVLSASVGTQCDDRPLGPTSYHSDAESDATEPGYASVRRDSTNRSARLLDATPSHQPRLATPPTAATDGSPTAITLQPQREPLASSSPQERPFSASELPSITSGLSFHSNSSDNSVLNPIPKDSREGSPNQVSSRRQNQQKERSEQEKQQLYSRVVKRKDRGKSTSAELPPKALHSCTRGNRSPHSKRGSPKAKQLSQKDRSPKVREDHYLSTSTPIKDNSGHHSEKTAEKTSYDDLSPGAKRASRLDWQGSPGGYAEDSEDGDYEEEDDTPELTYTDEDYSMSDEQLERYSNDHTSTGVRDSVTPEVVRAKQHHRSATHPTHRPPLSSSADKKSQDGLRRRHSASYRYASSPPHTYTGGETWPVVHPVRFQPASQPLYDHTPTFFFSEMQPNGPLQYYTATPVHSQSPLHMLHAQQPALGWQGAPAPVVPLATVPTSSQLDSANTNQLWSADLVDSKHVSQSPLPSSTPQVSPAKQGTATSASHTTTSPQKIVTQTASPKEAQQTCPTSQTLTKHSSLPSKNTKSVEDVTRDPSPRQKCQEPHPLGDSLSPPSSKRPPLRKSPNLPQHGSRGNSALLSVSHGSASPLLKGMSTRVRKKIEFSDLNVSWHGSASGNTTGSRLPEKEAEELDVDAEETSHRDPTSSASPRLGTGPGHRTAPSQKDNKARVYRDLLCLVEQREAGLRKEVGTLHSANTELQAENAALKQLYEGLKRATSTATSDTSQQQQPVDGDDPDSLSEGALASRSSQATPLLLQTYTEKVREKDQLLKARQEEIAHLKAEISSIAEENQALLVQSRESLTERESWQEVAERTRGVLEENGALQRQLELQREKAREVKREHQARVSQLSTEIARLKKERQTLARDLHVLRQNHAHLQEQFEQLASRSARQVSVEEHQQALQEVQSLLEDLAERNEERARTQEVHMRVMEKEKRALVTKYTDAKAIILQLEEQCASLHRANRNAQENIALQKCELEAARDREVLAHEQLNRAVMQVEKTMAERETFAKIAKSQQKARDRASTHQVRHEHAISKLEKRLESCKQQAGRKLDTASVLLHEQQRDYKSQRRYYEEEIKHLRSLLSKKQEDVESLAKGKRDAEQQLGLMWRASTSSLQAKPSLQ